MDFAIFIGEEKTVIYKAGQGIVLNEPSMVARRGETILAVGKDAVKYIDARDVSLAQVVRFGCIQNVDDASVFLAYCIRKLGTLARCLVCIPSSLGADALDDYKTAIYTAGVADAEFVPAVIATLFVAGYDIFSDMKIMSIVVEGESADMTIVKKGEIIDGGTLFDMKNFDLAKNNLLAKHEVVNIHHGERITVMNGAGQLLSRRDLIKKIVRLN